MRLTPSRASVLMPTVPTAATRSQPAASARATTARIRAP